MNPARNRAGRSAARDAQRRRPGARLGRQVARARVVAADVEVLLLAELRQVLGILGRELRERLRVPHGAPSESSSRRLVSTDATRLPKTLVTWTVTSVVSPAVVMRLIATRVKPLKPDSMFTRV